LVEGKDFEGEDKLRTKDNGRVWLRSGREGGKSDVRPFGFGVQQRCPEEEERKLGADVVNSFGIKWSGFLVAFLLQARWWACAQCLADLKYKIKKLREQCPKKADEKEGKENLFGYY